MLRLTVTRQDPDRAELQVDGRLVEEDVPLLAAEGSRLLLGSRQLVLGLAGLTYIDPAGLGLLATVRFLTSLVTTSRVAMAIFMTASALITVVTFNGLLSVLSGLGSLFGTAGTFCRDDKHLRQIMLIGTSLWLVHNILAKSPTAVVMEALFITSNLVGYYRFYMKRL